MLLRSVVPVDTEDAVPEMQTRSRAGVCSSRLLLLLVVLAGSGRSVEPRQPAPLVETQAVDCPCGEASLCEPVRTAKPKREIYAFLYPVPSLSSASWQRMDWKQITTVCFCGHAPRDLVCDAHRRGARAVTMTWLAPTDNKAAQDAWAEQLLELARVNGTDGVNIDIEGYGSSLDPQPSVLLTAQISRLVAKLRTQNPLAQITMDSIGLPRNGIWWTGYDWRALSKTVDFLIPMMYDMLNADACSRGNCSLPARYARFANSPYPAYLETVEQYASIGVPPGKLVFALPFYGYVIPCSSADSASSCTLPVPWPDDPLGPWPCTGQQDRWCSPRQVSYGDVAARLHLHSSGPWRFDPGSVTAFVDYHNSSGGREQIWFDDPSTLAVKVRWMASVKLRGLAVWTATSLNYTARGGAEAARMWGALGLFSKGLLSSTSRLP